MNSDKPFLVYKSSAGSGKTFTLARTFLSTILKSENPEYFTRVLAITFTVKAAAEMKQRITSYLSFLSGNEKNARKDAHHMLEALVNSTGLSKDVIRQRSSKCLHALIHNYGELSIMTIDRFVTRVIKSFSSDLALSPDFDIEIDHKMFVQRVLNQLFEHVGNDPEFTQLVLRYLQFRLNEEASGKLDDAIANTAYFLLNEEFYFIKKRFKSVPQNKVFELNKKLRERHREIETRLKDQAKSALKIISENGLAAEDFYQTNRGVFGFFTKVCNGELNKILDPGSYATTTVEQGKWQSKTKNPAVEAISSQLHRIFSDLTKQQADVEEWNLLKSLQKEVFRLGFISALLQFFEEVKTEDNIRLLSDFNHIIADRLATEQTSFIFERIGKRYNHVLIDEFQDTSTLQWQNLIPLIENSLSEANITLIVGDAKQSIYRFRGSEPGQFTALPNVDTDSAYLFESSYEAHVLDKNFRSANQIVKFNNAFFNALINNANSLSIKNTYRDLYQIPSSNKSGVVQWWIEPKATKQKKEALMEQMVDRIENLIENNIHRPGDICCLLRTNNEAAQISAALMARQISVTSEESLLLRNNPSVKLIIGMIEALSAENDPYKLQQLLARIQQLRPVENFHQVAAKLKSEKWNLNKLLNFLNIDLNRSHLQHGDTFVRVYKLARAFQIETSDPFLLKLFDLCIEYEAGAHYLKSTFIEFWEGKSDNLSIELPLEGNAVRVMTIHKSKGLEFPAVMLLLPDPARQRLTKSETWIDLEGRYGIDMIPMSTSSLADTNFSHLLEEEKAHSGLDYINLLYVAFTRAELRLEIFSTESSPKSDPFHFIKEWPEWNPELNCLIFQD